MVHLTERLSRACLCCLVAMSFSALTSQHQTFVLFVELEALLLDVNPGGHSFLGSNTSTPGGASSFLLILFFLIRLLGMRDHSGEQATEMVKACS